MKMKLKYTSFTTSSEFEKWQDENPKATVAQITPIIGGLQMNQTNPEQLDAKLAPVAICVVYHESI